MNLGKFKQWYPNISASDLSLLELCLPPEIIMPPEELPEFVWIPECPFVMGDIFHNASNNVDGQNDEVPLRILKLPGFWIAINVVTNREYLEFLDTEYTSNTTDLRTQITELPESAPVHSVNWDEAFAYCKWREAQTPGKRLCLPTEAQWEKAAGWHLIGDEFELGRKYEFGTGDDVDYEQTAFNRKTNFPYEVSKLSKGVNGLKGASGNVWEWCMDYYQADFYKECPDTTFNAQVCKRQVLRGGSWANVKRRLRISNRLGSAPSTRNDNFGFRLVVEPNTTGETA